MSKKTGYLFGILLTIVIGMILMWYLCCKESADTEGTLKNQDNQEEVNTPPPPVVINTTTNMGFTFKDSIDGNFAYKSDDNFNFNISDFNILTPISEKIDMGIGTLQTHLDGNLGKSIDVTGLYTSSENNTSAFPNLGVARANAVKNYLRSKGISSMQINIFGKEDNTLVSNDSIFSDSIRFLISESTDKNDESEALTALKKRINDDPLILHFGNAQASINPTVAQRQKIANINRYLDKVEGATITIEGHTDNTGSRATNIELGKKRANSVKRDFINNGISEARIITSSKGPDEPIASNATEEGKAKNRRSIVTIN
jgi:outer membrane protein OmpA-like peptidoglycan-associated protein